jgi:hypothetical protein
VKAIVVFSTLLAYSKPNASVSASRGLRRRSMYCPAQALASTGATGHPLERHNLLCPRQDCTRSNLSETVTLIESSRHAGLTAGTSRGHFARARAYCSANLRIEEA